MSSFPRLPDVRRPGLVLWLALCCAPPALAADARSANSNTLAPAVAAPAGPTLGTPEIKPGFAGSFLSSNFARQHEDPQQAAKYLAEALKLDPTNENLMLEAMRMDLLAGNMNEAFNYANKVAGHAKDDPLVATLLMLEEVKQGDYAKAQGWAMQAPQVGLFGVVRPVVLEWLGIGKGDVKGSADLQAAIDKSGFFAPFLTYHMALMDDVLGNTDAAQAAYLKSSSDQAITPYRVTEAMANFYARHNQWDKAQAVFDAYAKANPDSSLIPGKLSATNPPPQPLVGNARDGLAELFFTTASILFGEEAAQDTYLYLRLALDLKPDLPPAQLMLANLYEQDAQYERAIATYDSIKPGNVFYRRGQIRKALNLEALDRKPEAIALLDRIAADNPGDNTALISKGDMLREAERYPEAIIAYSDAIKRAEPLKAGDWPLLYARGISYERSNDWSKAEGDFNRALTLEPNQPDVLNYLAYSWLTMGKNVEKARDYLELALSARPGDAHIIDSMGWAEYIAGNYPKAVDYFEKAVDTMPDDPTVNDHLGDAYWRAGRQVEARYQWQRALADKPDEQSDVQALEDKLKNGLPAAAQLARPAQEQSRLSAPVVAPSTQMQ